MIVILEGRLGVGGNRRYEELFFFFFAFIFVWDFIYFNILFLFSNFKMVSLVLMLGFFLEYFFLELLF